MAEVAPEEGEEREHSSPGTPESCWIGYCIAGFCHATRFQQTWRPFTYSIKGGQRPSGRSCGSHRLRVCRWRYRNTPPESKCGFRASATRPERSTLRFGRRGLTHGQRSESIWSVGSAGLPGPSRRRSEIGGINTTAKRAVERGALAPADIGFVHRDLHTPLTSKK